MKRFCINLLLMTICVSSLMSQVIKESDEFSWQKFHEDGYVGAKNQNGKILIPALYEDIEYVYGCLAAIGYNKRKVLYSKKGKNLMHGIKDVTKIEFDKREGSLFFLTTSRFTMAAINCQGELIIPEDNYKYLKCIGDEEKGFAIAAFKNGNFGVFNKKGKNIIPFDKFLEVHWITNSNTGLKFICNSSSFDGLHCVYDGEGNELLRSKYRIFDHVKSQSGYYYSISSDNMINENGGKIDLSGNMLEEPKLISEEIINNYFNSNYNLIRTKDYHYGVSDEKGKTIIPALYDKIFFYETYFGIIKDGLWGAYDINGKCLFEPQYTLITRGDNFYYVENKNTLIITDLNGKDIIRGRFKSAYKLDYLDNRSYVITGGNSGKCALFNKYGKQMTPFKYTQIDYINKTNTNYYRVYIGNKVGVCDNEGKEIIPPAFTNLDFVQSTKLNYFILFNGSRLGICDTNGKIIVPVETFSIVEKKDDHFLAKDDEWICKFSFNGNLLSDNKKNLERDKYITIADDEFEKHNYSKSADYYKKAIDIRPSATLYFNVGVSHYNNNKYNKAIDFFLKCLDNKPSQHLIDRSKNLIAKARQLQAEKIERRQQLAANIFGMVLGVATAVVQSQYGATSYSSNGGYSKRNTNMDYLLDPSYTIQQVNNENWSEYLRDTNGGKTMSYDEWYSRIKVPALQAAKGGKDSDVGYSKTSSSSIQSSGSSRSCRFCHGTKTCETCDGAGRVFVYGTGNWTDCINCKDGICSHCNGTGKE